FIPPALQSWLSRRRRCLTHQPVGMLQGLTPMPEDVRGVAEELSLVLVRDGNSLPARDSPRRASEIDLPSRLRGRCDGFLDELVNLSCDALGGKPACLFKVAVGRNQLVQAFHTPTQFISRASVFKRLSKSGGAMDQIRNQIALSVNLQHCSLCGALDHLRRQPELRQLLLCHLNPINGHYSPHMGINVYEESASCLLRDIGAVHGVRAASSVGSLLGTVPDT